MSAPNVPLVEPTFAVTLTVEDWASIIATLAQSSSVSGDIKSRITTSIYHCAERST